MGWVKITVTVRNIYGDPLPALVAGRDGRMAFWNRGDGWDESGAYTVWSLTWLGAVTVTLFAGPLTAVTAMSSNAKPSVAIG